MALFEWSDDYSVHVPSIDEQHKMLVRMLNELHDGMSRGAADDRLGEVLNGLIEYTSKHFAHEEALFAKYNYPDAATHIAEHQRLVAQVLEFKEKLETKHATINMELLRFLKDWLIGHILGSDKKYSSLFADNHVP